MIGAFRKTKFLLLFNLFSAKVSTNIESKMRNLLSSRFYFCFKHKIFRISAAANKHLSAGNEIFTERYHPQEQR